MKKQQEYSSKQLFDNFGKNLESYISNKEPLLINKIDKSDFIKFIDNLSEFDKEELYLQIDLVLSGYKTINEVEFTYSKLRSNYEYILVFYRMAKYYNKLYNDTNKNTNNKYQDMSEKELLIEILNILKK